MDTQMYNTNYVMFAGPNILALYIRYLMILTLLIYCMCSNLIDHLLGFLKISTEYM